MPAQSILITGAGSGIGYAAAQWFATAGWYVGAFDLARESMQTLVATHGESRVMAGVMDVTDPESVAAGVETFVQASGGWLDCVLNNAGLLAVGHFAEISGTRHTELSRVNVEGVMQVAYAAHSHLAATPGARLINMASAAADYGVPDFASYSASKFAVRGLTEALNLEWRSDGIYVCDVMPPFVRTPMLEDAPQVPVVDRMGVHLTAEDVVAEIWRAAHARRRSKVHWPVSGRYKLLYYPGLLLPTWLKRLFMRVISHY